MLICYGLKKNQFMHVLRFDEAKLPTVKFCALFVFLIHCSLELLFFGYFLMFILMG